MLKGEDEPSLHLSADEALTIIDGKGTYSILDNLKNTVYDVNLSSYHTGEPDSSFYCRINKYTKHQIKIKSDYLLFHICTNGPFDRGNTVFL